MTGHPTHHSKPDNSSVDAILRDKMEEIVELIEAIAAGEKDCDIKLAALLDGEAEAVRVAIIDTLRTLLQDRAAEKEHELNQYLDAQKRIEATRQRNIFYQWLAWIMSEETLRKIREVFTLRPKLESQVRDIGQDLAAKGVLTQMELYNKRELGGLSANLAKQQGQTPAKGTDKGRG